MANSNTSIYKDISTRTGGDIYIGVVGPVRTGKSTFIKKFMESTVIPNITGEYDSRRARDEMPQSAGGKTVMTTEPKFVPDEAVKITVGGNTELRVKMIDCVGYLIPGVLGDTEEGEVRMVHTPWSEEAVPFDVAAETGTRKVINEHSTIGILVTSDGSFGDLPRENYIEAEQRVANELNKLGKPFAIILNSAHPESDEAENLALSLEEKYGAPVALLSCLDIDSADIEEILKMIVLEFPIKEVSVNLPVWTGVLDETHWLRNIICDSIKTSLDGLDKTGEIGTFRASLQSKIYDGITHVTETEENVSTEINRIDMGTGNAYIDVKLPDGLFYKIIGEMTGIKMESEADLLSALRTLSQVKKEYDKFSAAIDEVNEKGYGIVLPEQDDLTLEEPEIVKQAGGYGLRLRASAPSIHMIKAGIETELNPIVGTEQQSEEVVRYLLDEFEGDPRGIWDTNLFGKSIYELVNEGLHAKLDNMPDDAREKIGETLSKVINEGSNGLICILL